MPRPPAALAPPFALLALAAILTATPVQAQDAPSQKEQAAQYTNRGMEAVDAFDGFARGELVEAEVWFRRAVEADAALPGPYVGLSMVEMYSGYDMRTGFDQQYLDRALAAVDKALSLAPDDPDAHAQRGYVLMYMGETEAAEREAKMAQGPGGRASGLMGELAIRRGELDAARGHWEEALTRADMPGRRADAYDALGEIAVRRGRYDEAAGLFREALSIRTDSGWEASNYALALMNAGRLDEAVEVFLFVKGKYGFPEASANLAVAYLKKGIALHEKGDAAGAELFYEKATEEDPALKAAYTNLAALYEAQGRTDELTALCRRMKELYPDDPWLETTCGQAVRR